MRIDHSLWCWGDNQNGELGDGAEDGADTPQRVVGRIEWGKVFAGNGDACAVDRYGDGYCWGYDAYGVLGNGQYKRSLMGYNTPQDVIE